MVRRMMLALVLSLTPTLVAQPESLPPETQEAARQLLGLPPGSTVVLEKVKTTDNGTLEVQEEATGTGAGLNARGEKIVSEFNSSAPNAALGNGKQALGGNTDSSLKITGPANLFANPALWVGILCILGAGFSIYRMNIRAATILGILGAALMAAAMMPTLLIYILAAVAGFAVIAYLNRDLKSQTLSENVTKYKKALTTVVKGVADFGSVAKDTTNPTVTPDAYDRLKEAIASHTTDADDLTIKEVKTEARR